MKDKILPYLYVFLIGVGGALMTFVIMNSFSKTITYTFVSVLYLLLGVWVSRLQTTNFLIAIILLNSVIWAVFTPMAIEIYFFIPLLILPPVFSALGLLLDKKLHRDTVKSVNVGNVLQSVLSNYVLPISLGFFGMFIVLFPMFFGFRMQSSIPVYVLAYPVVFMLIAALLSYNREQWLQDGLLICLIPVLYWMVLLPFKGNLDWSSFDYSNQSTVMFVLMPIVILLVLVTGFLVRRNRKIS